ESAGAYSFVTEAYVDGLGRFEIMLPKVGEFRVGTWLPDTADYSMVSETMVGPSDAKAPVVLRPHDASVSGVFTLDGQSISGQNFYANVAAFKITGGEPVFKIATFTIDGTFDLRLEEGTWGVLYNVINHGLGVALKESNRRFLQLDVGKGQSLNLEVPLVRITGELKVVVLDEDNASVKEGVYPWVEQDDGRGKFYKDLQLFGGEVFKAPVPLPMRVRVGAKISKELRSAGYLEPKIEKVILDTTQNTKLVTLRLIHRKPEEFLAGMVTDDQGAAIPGAFVWAWSPRGQTIETHADANGSFRFEVKAGAKWYLGADFAGGASTSGAVLLMDKDLEVDLTTALFRDDLRLVLRPSFRQLPDAVTDTFDPSRDYLRTLSDGTRIFIPANSILLQIEGGRSRSRGTSIQYRKGLVTMTVTPVQTGLAKGINNRPLDHGYSISFADENGRETQISKSARLSIPFSASSLAANKARKEDLALSFYSTTRGWMNVPAVLSGGYLHAYVDHFSKWAVTVAPPEVRPASLPNVLVSGLNADQVTERWYQSDWLGSFNDAGSGWIYHDEHGWLYPAEDGSGNYWLYHPNLGWLWTGPSFYGNAQGRYFLFSPKADSWLYYESSDKTFYVYKDSTRMNHAGVAIARLQVTSSDASFGQVTGDGYHEIGSMVKLTAVANSGYRFTEWRSSTRGMLGTGATLDVQIGSGETITGVFAKMTSEDILGGVFD
ncbi:MAG: carboxypeptidase regulatory-like domain-containing protein, partial [Opitutae bacterium]|nr:carboxypeptidase regulatory-like domain-containing protein [Opitutae bacterium]